MTGMKFVCGKSTKTKHWWKSPIFLFKKFTDPKHVVNEAVQSCVMCCGWFSYCIRKYRWKRVGRRLAWRAACCLALAALNAGAWQGGGDGTLEWSTRGYSQYGGFTRARSPHSARSKYGLRSGHGVRPGAPLAIWSGTEREAGGGGGRRARARAPGIRLWQGGGAGPAHKSNFAHSHALHGPPPPYSIFGAGHIFIIITPHIHS